MAEKTAPMTWIHLHPKRFRLVLAAVITTVVILAVVIPTTLVLCRKSSNMPPKSNVLVPLYIYPAPGAWDPLQEMVTTYEGVDFTIIVNPNSGPGTTAVPDSNYTREISKLNEYSNVRLLGYVATNYAKRNITAVLKDVETYGNWSTKESAQYPGLAVNGIFFDEAPSSFSNSTAKYLAELENAVKRNEGLGPHQLTIFNPGTIPASTYLRIPNATVLFEAGYSLYKSHNSKTEIKSVKEIERKGKAIVMHSVPKNFTLKQDKELIHGLRQVAEYVFTTHLSSKYYEQFDPKWADFVRYMAN